MGIKNQNLIVMYGKNVPICVCVCVHGCLHVSFFLNAFVIF